MKKILGPIILVLLIDLCFQRCANIGSPTGGPRDTIPPILLESDPINGSTLFQKQEFALTFSEFVKADKIQQQLIITPITENKYKTTVKKNVVILKFENPFQDSTTYNLNFADGITDITESNPAVNLSIAFSTGDYIDSLQISGEVIDLFKQEQVKSYLVGLYPRTDTLDYFKHKPTYFTTTNDSGKFELSYLKSGIYNLLVFNDENRNITFDPETEQHGFIKDSIRLDTSIHFVKPINTLLQNIKPITFINSRPTGPYIELKYSKQIDEYEIQPSFLRHSLTGETKDVIRLYKSDQVAVGDSIQLIATVRDSLDNQTIDTISTAYIESNRKPTDFSMNVRPTKDSESNEIQYTVVFNKPVYQIDSTKIFFQKDSTFKRAVMPRNTWNANHTLLTLNTQTLKQNLVDTIRKLLPRDTTNSLKDPNRQNAQSNQPLPAIELVLDTAVFVSIEQDSSSFMSLRVPLQESTDFGTVKLTIQTVYPNFNIQLLNKNDEVSHSAWNQKEITFAKVPSGKYAIRALIDNNGDGQWSAGNLLLNTIPEEIYLHKEETVVRENWVLEIDISF